MADSLFDLYFSGKTIDEEAPEAVRLRVGKMFSADNETLNRLFSGNPVRIKSGVNQETAIKYRVALRDAGALLEIRPCKKADIKTSSQTDPASGETFTLLPPNSGNLIDCAIPVDPFPLPDITDITLAPAGVVIDESDQPAAQTINTNGFTLTAPNSGSLEDCRPVVEASPIPDTSHIELARDEQGNPFLKNSDD